MAHRARLGLWVYGAAGTVYALDQLTKAIVVRTLRGRPPIRIVPGVVDLNYTENAGGAFGLFGGQPWLFFAATLAVSVVIVIASMRVSDWVTAVALGLILGGALGNLTDRILRGPGVSGRVVDFIDFHIWPVFNLADSAIVVGALVMVAAGLRRQE